MAYQDHDLYKTGDSNAPEALDRAREMLREILREIDFTLAVDH